MLDFAIPCLLGLEKLVGDEGYLCCEYSWKMCRTSCSCYYYFYLSVF